MENQTPQQWSEESTQTFVDYGHVFVPNREQQIATIVTLIPPTEEPFRVFELCCGEGLLAEAILLRFPTCSVVGYDGSPEMLARASARLASVGERFQPLHFDLGDHTWRQVKSPVQAVVSSLAIHHLDGPGKQDLFRDVYQMLAPGGVFVIADVIEPATPPGWQIAAEAWDAAVRDRSIALNGDTNAFEFFQQERWNMYHYFDPDDIDHPSRLFDQLQWLSNAGFVDVDILWMNAGHAIFGGRK